MATRTEAQEDNNSSCWVCNNSLDDLFDYCHGEDSAANMGSL